MEKSNEITRAIFAICFSVSSGGVGSAIGYEVFQQQGLGLFGLFIGVAGAALIMLHKQSPESKWRKLFVVTNIVLAAILSWGSAFLVGCGYGDCL